MSERIQLIEVKSELGAGTRGASLGIGAMKIASFKTESRFFERYAPFTVPDENELLFTNSPTIYARYIDGIVKVYDYVIEEVSSQLNQGSFPIVLAGDHSTAGGTIAGIRKAYPNKRLGVIWIDAHADLHTPFTTPSGNVHGMPLAACLGIDNMERQRNQVNEEEQHYWNLLKSAGGVQPKIRPEELVFVGVRSTEPEEDFLIEKYGIRNFKVDEVRERGAITIAEEALRHLANCDMIYVSFDVDSMDCDLVSCGTGTPVPGGLTAQEARDMLCRLVQDDRTCCFEVTEVNPTLDNKCNVMAETAFETLVEATKVVEKRFMQKGQTQK